jgi:hypothetical protein
MIAIAVARSPTSVSSIQLIASASWRHECDRPSRTVFRQQRRADNQQQCHDRNWSKERRTPPEASDQQSTDHRPNRSPE